VIKGELSGIEELLGSRIGLDPISVGSPLILRAVRQRMKELGLDNLGAYEQRARQSEPELQALIEEVVVAESWFFRDERPFQWFGESVCTQWLDNPARPPLRILSLACAGGEEPYSIAMALLDLGFSARRFQIEALDVSARRLAIARSGVYSLNAFRGPELGYRERYFREHPDGYEITPAVRATVRFLQASALDPRLLQGSPPYDVVFCRNLLIYLDAPARACVMATIDRLLAADGLLIIGHADRLDCARTAVKFTVVGHPGCFAYRRAACGAEGLPQLESEPPRPGPRWVTPERAPTSTTAVHEPVNSGAAALQPDGAAAAVVSTAGADLRPTLLDQAAELANQGRFNDAITACERHLRQKGLTPPAYYLMGMICQAAGEGRRAEDCFHKVVYLDPRHDEALLALALLAERRGDDEAAAGFRRRAERTVTMNSKRVT
jgi:chemotaxis protein methyltransferase WspC